LNLESATSYLSRCRNFDGGFGAVPGAESHSGQIFCCVAALAILDRLDLIDDGVLGWWLCERQTQGGGLNGRPEKKPDVCFGVDSRVLTNFGFLFLDEIQHKLKEGNELFYAAYDVGKKEMVYVRGVLRLPDNVDRKLISFLSSGNANNQFSIRVTGDHDVFVQTGAVCDGRIEWESHHKMKAGSLLREPRPTRWLGFVANGFAGDPNVIDDLQTQLGLSSAEQVVAFLEFYGFWVGDGTIEYGNGSQYVIVSQNKPVDVDWVRKQLGLCGLAVEVDYLEHQPTSRGHVGFRIKNPRWFGFFAAEYGKKSTPSASSDVLEDVKSVKGLAKWVWRLNRSQSRLVVAGLRRASGSSDQDEYRIFTSDVQLKEELCVLLLHAGYSPYYFPMSKKGSIRGFVKNPNVGDEIFSVEEVKAQCNEDQFQLICTFDPHTKHTDGLPFHPIRETNDKWCVGYQDDRDPRDSAMPNVEADGISEVAYDGRLWCVTVDHPDALIIAQQATRVEGMVSRMSRPVVIGNCYSWWVLSSLSILGHINWIDRLKLGEYILSCQDDEGGGISDRPGNQVDIFHTYFGIAGLSLLGYPTLAAIDPVHAMPLQLIKKLGLDKNQKPAKQSGKSEIAAVSKS